MFELNVIVWLFLTVPALGAAADERREVPKHGEAGGRIPGRHRQKAAALPRAQVLVGHQLRESC